MIDKLIEKYKKIVIASNEIVEEQRQQRFPDEITIRSEITRFCVYETVIQDLEELKKIVREELYNSDCTVAEYNGACERLGVDTDE